MTDKQLKVFLEEKLYVYHKQLQNIDSHPELMYMSERTYWMIKGKLELIHDMSRELKTEELRRRPPIREMII